MYFSYELIKAAYDELIKLDTTEGKSRKEKVSGLRYLLATSRLLNKEGTTDINLAVGSALREEFVDAVGEVVAVDENGLYSKDFAQELDVKKDYGVGSNFLTTRLAGSRSGDVRYPGRPGSLLLLKNEHVSILDNAGRILESSYGIKNIKSALSIWLLRNDNFEPAEETIPVEELRNKLAAALAEKYTSEIVNIIKPSDEELTHFLSDFSSVIFSSLKPDISDISGSGVGEDNVSQFVSKALTNTLPDEDEVFQSVEQLLSRGAKGILFSGPPGTSKTWYALKIALKIIDGDEARLERVQFHPSFSYEDFIEGLVSVGSPMGSEPLFKPKDKVFLNLCEKARHNIDQVYILIIDEFSRGDPSKIFGELLTYIEPDYREITFRLPYSEKETTIPQNVVIFATTNPYDKSVSDLDAAMERRFDVVELNPSVNILKSLLIASDVQGERIGKIIEFFNTANRLSPHGFGHTYFKSIKDETDLILLWNHKLKFLFEKMFRFEPDSYNEVKAAFLNIISNEQQDSIA